MSFQLLKFAPNSRSPSKDNSPAHSKTPHVRLKEEEDYTESTSFPAKGINKYNEEASTETLNFFKSMASPQSLTVVKTPKTPSNLKSMLPPLIIHNSKRSSLQVEPHFQKLQQNAGKLFEDVNDRGVSEVLQDVSPMHNEHKLHHENRIKKEKSASVSKKSISEFKLEQKPDERMHNEPLKDEISKSGRLGGSFIDSRRMFIIDERSSRKKDTFKPNADNHEEGAITEEDNNISLCSGKSVTAERIDIFSKYSQMPVNEENTGTFSNLRNLYQQDSEPLGSQTHRGPRRGSLIDRAHTNNEEEEDRTVNGQNQAPQEQAIQVRNTETQSNQVNVDVQKIADIDASLSLRKICALCITIGLSTFFLMPMINDYEGYRRLFLVIYGFLAYNAIENGIRLRSPESHDWKRKDRLFDFFDAIAMIFFLACVDLRLLHIISHNTVAFIPLLILTITYYFISSAPRSTKDVKTLMKFLYTCQTLLIVLKLNGYIQWEWKAVVLVMWAYFSFAGLYAIIIAILLIAVIFVALFRLQSYTTSNIITRAIGLLWYSAYYGLSIIALIALFGMTQAYDSNEGTILLEQALIVGRYAVYGILVYTLVLFFQLKKFVKTFNQNQSAVEPNDSLVDNIQPRHVLDFQVEKAPSYFVMLSSTYFLPLHEGFLTKSKKRFQRLKSTSTSLKWSASKSRVLLQQDSTMMPNRTILIEELKKDKEALDQKLEGPPESLKNSLVKTFGFLKLKKFDSNAVNLTQQPYKGETNTVQLEEGHGSVAVDHKLFASVDDMYDISPICRNRKPALEEDNLCYICFERNADAVLMDCGHAGICCECTINMIRDKNECMECRKAVKAVYKVDKSLKLAGIVKGSELTKVIEIGMA